jgi:hypothetical protein
MVAKRDVCVFICSSDSRRDILERVVPSLLKFWPDCPYPIYAGLNSNPRLWPAITSLAASTSEWRHECLEQLSQIAETHVIVVLDDFLFQRPVDQSRVSSLVSLVLDSDIAYLRLLPLGKSLAQRLIGPTRNKLSDGIESIHERRPFYSSLQIAIWEKSHLISMLGKQGSIWDFEHYSRPGVPHFAIKDSPPIIYRHLVEKGRWYPQAKSLLRQAGLPTDLGQRAVWPKLINLRLALDELRFYVLGYAIH